MALIGLKRASELTGKNQSTIHRAMKSGRLSYQTSDTGERLIDTSELDRVFPIQAPASDTESARNDAPSLQRNETQVALHAQLETERAKVALLQERVADKEGVITDLREDRDRWRAQAEKTTLLLTDQRQQQEAREQPSPPSALPHRRRWWPFGKPAQPPLPTALSPTLPPDATSA
jgi:hypothetical protein